MHAAAASADGLTLYGVEAHLFDQNEAVRGRLEADERDASAGRVVTQRRHPLRRRRRAAADRATVRAAHGAHRGRGARSGRARRRHSFWKPSGRRARSPSAPVCPRTASPAISGAPGAAAAAGRDGPDRRVGVAAHGAPWRRHARGRRRGDRRVRTLHRLRRRLGPWRGGGRAARSWPPGCRGLPRPSSAPPPSSTARTGR